MSISDWIDDIRWACVMMQARAFRRRLPYVEQAGFDVAFAPGTAGGLIYTATADDLERAHGPRRDRKAGAA